jgi:PEGA domain
MSVFRICTALVAAASLSACATITRGSKQKFAVTSEPSGADVKMTNGLSCTTPCKLKIDRKSDFVVHVTKEGYTPAEVRVQGKVKGGGVAAGLGNVLLGGVVGLGVDASTGANLNLTPNPVAFKLVATTPPVAVPAPDAAATVAPDAPAVPSVGAPATTAPSAPMPAMAPSQPSPAPAPVVAAPASTTTSN